MKNILYNLKKLNNFDFIFDWFIFYNKCKYYKLWLTFFQQEDETTF